MRSSSRIRMALNTANGRLRGTAFVAVAALAVSTFGQAAAVAAPVSHDTGTKSAAKSAPTMTAPDTLRAQMIARAEGHRVEVVGLRDETSSTYANPDSSLTAQVSESPVNVRRGDGWVPVDTTLSVGSDGRLHAGVLPYEMSLSDGGDRKLVDITPSRGHRATFGSVGTGTLPRPTVDGAVATYPDVSPNIDVRVGVTSVGFEITYILKKRPDNGPLRLRMPLVLAGLTPGKDRADRPQLTDARDGTTVLHSSPALMTDARATAAADGAAQVEVPQSIDAGGITLTPDSGFLADPATQYPVEIDPLYGVTFQYGTYVYEAAPTANYDASSYFRTGLATTSGTRQRTLMRFQLPTSLATTDVRDASLQMFVQAANSCATTQVLRTLGTAFNPSSVTWNTQPAVSGPYDVTAFTANCTGTWQTFHMTDLAKLWINGGVNNGFAITATNEADTSSNKVYRSEMYTGANGAYKPTLTVTYNSYPSTTAGRSVTPSSLYGGTTFVPSLTPTFRGEAADPDGGTNRIKVTVNDASTGAAVWTGAGNYVPVGALSSVTVPSGYLVNGGSYTWTAVQNDGIDDSLKPSSAAPFTVDTAPPATPVVASGSYPANAWQPGNSAGSFTFSSPGSTDVASWSYRFDAGTWLNAAGNVGATDSATAVSITPPAGWQTLHVVAIDRAGNRSPETRYSFGAGPAVTSPVDQTVSPQNVYLTAVAAPGNPNVRFQYRRPGDTTFIDIPPADVTSGNIPLTSWPVATTTSSDATRVTSPSLQLDLRKLLDTSGTGLGTAPVDGSIELQAQFDDSNGNPTVTTIAPATTVTLDHNAFGASFATTPAGPGTLSLQTGNYAVNATDATIANYASDLTLSRTFNSLANAPTVLSGVFGPGWVSNLQVDTAGSDFTSLTDTGSTVIIHETDGSELRFTKSGSTYLGQHDADSDALTVAAADSNGPYQFTLRDADNNTTVFQAVPFGAPASDTSPHTLQPQQVQQPGSSQNTSYTYISDGNGGLIPSRLLAPFPPGVSCPSDFRVWTSTQLGCRALDLTYIPVTVGTTTRQQLSRATLHALDGTGSLIATDVACYSYNSLGQLNSEWDPRITSPSSGATCSPSGPTAADLPTSYSYNPQGLLAGITPPGLAPWVFSYDTSYRLTSVTRTHTGNGSSGGQSSETTSVLYNVPIGNDTDASTGLHPDLSSDTEATWAQTDTPVTATAVFTPGKTAPVVPSSGFTTGLDYRDGIIHALDANGWEVNTASYSGTGQGGWKIGTTEYDSHGNTIRSLTADNRDRALHRSDAPASSFTLPPDIDTAAASRLLDTVNLYQTNPNDASPASPTSGQLDLTDTFGPESQIILPDSAGALAGNAISARAHTHYDYDSGAETNHPAIGPGGTKISLHLVTDTWTEASVGGDVYPGSRGSNTYDRRTTTYSYSLGGTDATGWTFRTPLQTTTTPGGTASAITHTTVLDPNTGLVTEQRMPSDTAGSNAGTTDTLYYGAGLPNNGTCINSAWYMQVCRTAPKNQPGVSGLPSLPVTNTTYDYLLRPTQTTETVTDASNNLRVRTSTTSYENGGLGPRPVSSSLSSPVGTAIPDVTISYDPSTGLPISVSTPPNSGTGQPLTTSYDDFGRPVSFTDADNATTTTSYDTHGRPSTVTETYGGSPVRTTTMTYESGSEHRALLTSLNVSGIGTFTGTYDADGTLLTQTYPNQILAAWTSNEAGAATSVTYSKNDNVWFADSQTPNVFGQWRQRIGQNLNTAEFYSYDDAGRLTRVQDAVTSTGVGYLDCLTRQYAFDGSAGANSNRTSFTSYPANSDHGCQNTTGGTTVSSSYDTADRLQSANRAAGITYDAFGRTTLLPAALTTASGTGGTDVSNGYYTNDLVASQSAGGVSKTWQLDATEARDRTFTDSSSGTVKTNHYDSGSGDSPGWIDEGANNAQTRYSTGLDGNLAATDTRDSTTGALSNLVYNLTDLHGDIVTTATPGATNTYDGPVSSYDEFGNVKTPSGTRYGWLGGKQRSTDILGSLTLMGARLYSPAVGRFLQTDPVPGGSANDYDYAAQDPVNKFDLDGRRLDAGETMNGLHNPSIVCPRGYVSKKCSGNSWQSFFNGCSYLPLAGSVCAAASVGMTCYYKSSKECTVEVAAAILSIPAGKGAARLAKALGAREAIASVVEWLEEHFAEWSVRDTFSR